MKTLLVYLGLISVLMLGAGSVHAQDLGAVKDRMTKRQPTLDALRQQGIIGENNRGFTEVRKAQGDAGAVSSAENSDREVVYAQIAKSQGTNSDQVGRARARQIAASSVAGVWLQRESGEWYQK